MDASAGTGRDFRPIAVLFSYLGLQPGAAVSGTPAASCATGDRILARTRRKHGAGATMKIAIVQERVETWRGAETSTVNGPSGRLRGRCDHRLHGGRRQACSARVAPPGCTPSPAAAAPRTQHTVQFIAEADRFCVCKASTSSAITPCLSANVYQPRRHLSNHPTHRQRPRVARQAPVVLARTNRRQRFLLLGGRF